MPHVITSMIKVPIPICHLCHVFLPQLGQYLVLMIFLFSIINSFKKSVRLFISAHGYLNHLAGAGRQN